METLTGRIEGQVRQYVEGMTINSVDSNIIEQLIKNRLVMSVVDLYYLKKEDFSVVYGMDDITAGDCMGSIQQSKNNSLEQVLEGLNILSDRTLMHTLAQGFNTMQHLQNAGVAQLTNLEGIDVELAERIIAKLNEPETKDTIKRLYDVGVEMRYSGSADSHRGESLTHTIIGNQEREYIVSTERVFRERGDNQENEYWRDFWRDKRVVLTGALPLYTRDQAKELIESRGGTVTGSISNRTNLLIAGERSGSKLAIAREKGIPVMSGDAFLRLMRT